MMKKGILFASLAAVTVLVGCAKQEPQPQPVQQNTSVSQNAYSDKLGKLGHKKHCKKKHHHHHHVTKNAPAAPAADAAAPASAPASSSATDSSSSSSSTSTPASSQ